MMDRNIAIYKHQNINLSCGASDETTTNQWMKNMMDRNIGVSKNRGYLHFTP